MGMTRDDLFDELESTEKGGGRNPRLGVGTYLLMVTKGRLVPEEESRDKPIDQQQLQAVVVAFNVIEATDGSNNPAGTAADLYFRQNAAKAFARKKDKQALRAFVEATTGSTMEEIGREGFRDLFDAGEMRGMIVRCQVVPGKREGFPDYHWTAISQTPAEVLARRRGLEDE